jgi:hypothetical protein
VGPRVRARVWTLVRQCGGCAVPRLWAVAGTPSVAFVFGSLASI